VRSLVERTLAQQKDRQKESNNKKVHTYLQKG
jgi:hypothetical protein